MVLWLAELQSKAGFLTWVRLDLGHIETGQSICAEMACGLHSYINEANSQSLCSCNAQKIVFKESMF